VSKINTGLMLLVVLVSMLFVVSRVGAETLVAFAPERNSIVVRDIASSQLFKVHAVSPTALAGDGYGFRLQVGIKAGTKEHLLGMAVSQSESFHYRTRRLFIDRPEDQYRDYRLTYRFHHFLWRDIRPGLDLAIGPEIQLTRISTTRHFAPDMEVNFTERYFSTAFLFIMRYSPLKNLRLDVSMANGGLFGFESTAHSLSRNSAKRNTINGWLTAGYISLTWFGFGPLGISAYLQRRETVEIGRVFQQMVAENRWGLSISYRWE